MGFEKGFPPSQIIAENSSEKTIRLTMYPTTVPAMPPRMHPMTTSVSTFLEKL